MIKIIRQTRGMELETIEKNGEKQKKHKSCGKFLMFGVVLFLLCSFTNRVVGQSWSLDNGTLTVIDNSAFSNYPNPYPWSDRANEITKLIIGSGVTSIPSSAFYYCTGLTDVTLKDGVTPLSFNFSNDQFFYCPIKTFYWGRNLVQYGSPCANKATLTSVTIGNNVNSIGDFDFYNCTSLASVTIPSSITSIGNQAFYYCSNLKSITLSSSISSIGNGAFQYSGLTNIIIPNTVNSIGSSAFYNCTGLTDVTLVDGSTPLSFNFASDQFYNCPIKTVYWGRNLVQYGSPFADKATLTSVNIGNNVNSIGDFDFSNCTSLASVTIPSSITSIGIQAFNYCSNLKSITLPNSIASIGNGAFQYSGLTNISIPNTVNSIGSSAFYNCTGLTDVSLEDGATPLSFNNSSDQFYNCPIKTFYWGRNLVQYGSPVAGKTTFNTLTIGSNITSIGNYDFDGCTGLNQININATTPPTIYDNTFVGVDKNIPIIINCDYFADYQSAQYWSEFTNYQCTPDMVIINGVSWATRNVDKPGTFAAKPEDAGMFYQWNSKVGWSSIDPMINSNGGTVWDSNTPTGSTWDKSNDPSPADWRVPTLDELKSLLDAQKVTNEYATINGKVGKKFTDIKTGNFIFLPCPNYRLGDGSLIIGADGLLLYGVYWSNTQSPNYDDSAYNLFISTLSSSTYLFDNKEFGFSVRSVKDCVNCTSIEKIVTNQLTIFPNPAHSELFIKSTLPINKVEIYSLTGALLLLENNFNGKISVSALPKGVYMVKVYTDNGLVIEKVVKE